MGLLVFGSLFIISVVFLIKTNTSKKLEKTKNIHLFIYPIKGLFLFLITGCLFASVFNFEWNGPHHPHSMIGLLYIWFGLFGLILGLIIGLILSSLNKTNINKKLVIGSVIYLISLFIWFFSIPIFFS